MTFVLLLGPLKYLSKRTMKRTIRSGGLKTGIYCTACLNSQRAPIVTVLDSPRMRRKAIVSAKPPAILPNYVVGASKMVLEAEGSAQRVILQLQQSALPCHPIQAKHNPVLSNPPVNAPGQGNETIASHASPFLGRTYSFGHRLSIPLAAPVSEVHDWRLTSQV